MTFQDNYNSNIARRRDLAIEGYVTLADIGFDGDFVSPLQLSASSPTGPIIVGYNWFDAPSARTHISILRKGGYMPGIPFNKVMDRAFERAAMKRADTYMTQAFHLLPSLRSETIPQSAIDLSFDAVTRHELDGRPVIALGGAAAMVCRRHGVACHEVPHPSARNAGTYDMKAQVIAEALRSLR